MAQETQIMALRTDYHLSPPLLLLLDAHTHMLYSEICSGKVKYFQDATLKETQKHRPESLNWNWLSHQSVGIETGEVINTDSLFYR